MNDLLGDGGPGRDGANGFDLEAGISGAPPSPAPGPGDVSAQNMAKFLQEVNDVKNSMAQIRLGLQKLEDSHAESKAVTKASAMKDVKEKMDRDVDEISKLAHSLRSKIEALDRANIASRKVKGCEEGSSTDRTRMSVTATLKKKLKGLMDEFQALRLKFQDEYREVVERRYYTVTGQKPDQATIEHLIDTGDSEQIFQRAIQQQGRGQILETIAEIQERHDAVKDIERKLLELHQVFLDMAVLVEAQGDLIDNIQNQVSRAVDHVTEGTVHLQKAKKFQKSSRRCMCFMIVLLLIIILVVLLVVHPWK